ncbi:MAG: orotate phosphoribosyltransferase [Pseudomonadota bacterium]
MHDYQHDFIRLALKLEVLRFGSFTLKSGRVSPYFFNAGLFNTGEAAAELSRCYARAIVESGIEYDMIFGPAYKGISLAALSAAGLFQHANTDKPYAFNRKEAKTHGEGGSIIGAPLKGRVLVVDDVMTAGTAIGEAVSIIKEAGAELAGVVISLDRQERGQGEHSAVQQVSADYNVPVASIISLEHLLGHLREAGDANDTVAAIEAYRAEYGA